MFIGLRNIAQKSAHRQSFDTTPAIAVASTGKAVGRLLLSALLMLCAISLLDGERKAAAQELASPDLSNHRTYIVNGLASAIPNIGYGLRNLHGKLGGEYFAYLTPIEASGAEYRILRSVEAEYRKNPHVNINLIGVSYGGNIATWVATRLAYKKIPVNYLAVIDAPAPSAVSKNVHRVDNFVCRTLGCIGAKVRLVRGNKDTLINQFTYRVPHISLPNDKRLQQRIVSQLTATPLFLPGELPDEPGLVGDANGTLYDGNLPGNRLRKSYLAEPPQ